jgi:hypothetical protein
MPTPPGTPTNVRVGPGRLYIAPLGTTEPDDLTTGWNEAWVQVGYTDAGSTVGFDQTFEDIEVEEEYDALDTLQTARAITVSFEAAEVTATNLQRAFNGGTIEVESADEVVIFEPPPAGEVTRVMLGWEADDGKERWIFRRCVQTGNVDMSRQKAPNKATISMEFRATVPDEGGAPFKAILLEDFAGEVPS